MLSKQMNSSGGIVDIIWGAGVPMMLGKSNDGKQFAAILYRLEKTAEKVMSFADHASAKRCSTGHTTAENISLH
jgi:hypothetical protein